MTATSISAPTDLSVCVRFALRGLYVAPDALGKMYSWDTSNGRITLSLPVDPEDFRVEGDNYPGMPACAIATGNAPGAIIYLIHARIDFSGDVSLAEKEHALAADASGDARALSEFTRRTQKLWTDGYDALERAAHDWLIHVRVKTDQHWLGESIDPPAQYELGEILDTVADERLMAFGPLKATRVGGSSRALADATLVTIRDRLQDGVTADIADIFLSDARLLISRYDVMDPRRAVLLAGMACEIKAKLTLRAKVDPDKEPLLDLVLKRTSQLQSMLDKPLKAAIGISLCESDPHLYKLIHKLTDDRNGVVHRGAEIDESTARSLIAAAEKLFAWLDAL